ncbi:hypothetical protein [Stenotrophomonas acidaminiphila]|uniref:hypothetical protein n=1 Tax=Stenotrophomonas acidaminiphila TaxID=128780 RepID=UPI001FAF4E96|nr:hypothetical protein [Stenotrophomonas acidaminiphila]
MDSFLGLNDLQIKFFTALGQLGLTTAVAYVAYQQWQTARKKLKSDIFDKRFAAYLRIRDAIEFIFSECNQNDNGASAARANQMNRNAIEMEWLFCEEAAKLTERIGAALEGYVSARSRTAFGPPEERAKAGGVASHAEIEALSGFYKLKELISSDLKLEH